ncbi:umecyanin-like [Hordeum vulgare subsp. vulgare]|uniref:Predicted protein n=1 Tax=Hordeum vulgare subsp. vulgare TaxID=112509 RepID=F2EG30_HORVV|nr:umecyanin-like [Hordeum vulgare subsp. vulgare]KAI5020439.1 hypothetical protein ZWY2020_045327 [Hordeum vulgare]BAK06302.1 predicted protein [Hordeum vulgare subsp. vulgare]
MASKAHLSFLLLAAVVASLAGPSAGIFHIVGAGKGWRIAPNQTYYADWARTRDIHVGDKLMFLYRSGVYDIVQVPTKELFDACSMDNVTMRYQLGPTIVKLDTPGPRYYFCGVGKHCEGGQKVAVNVSGAPAAAVNVSGAPAAAVAAPETPAAAALPPASSTQLGSSTPQVDPAQASALQQADPAQASTLQVDPAALVDAAKKKL